MFKNYLFAISNFLLKFSSSFTRISKWCSKIIKITSLLSGICINSALYTHQRKKFNANLGINNSLYDNVQGGKSQVQRRPGFISKKRVDFVKNEQLQTLFTNAFHTSTGVTLKTSVHISKRTMMSGFLKKAVENT